MKLRSRFSIRTLMAVVALVAIFIGVAFEVRNHVRSDRLFSVTMSKYMAAGWHFQQAHYCRGRTSPYPLAERLKINGDYAPGSVATSLTGWKSEENFHEYWAQRLQAEGEGNLQQLEAIHARLLIP